MNMKKYLVIAALINVFSVHTYAKQTDVQQLGGGGFTQSIHIVNLLANTNLTDPGMTPTPIIVKYYNGYAFPCWTNTLSYQEDVTIHAGPTQGCLDKVTQVIIMPVIVADKLKTYRGPANVDIDTSKYASHIIVVQDEAPSFDAANGLVIKPGTLKAQVSADIR